MARSITLVTQLLIRASESADAATSPASASEAARTYDQYNLNNVLRSTSTPATGGRVVDLSKTTAAADTDIDLTAAPTADDLAVTADLTGKKLLAFILRARDTNVGNVTIKPHPTTNGYNLFGAGGLVVLGPGRHLAGGMASGSPLDTPAVAAGAKVIRISVGTVGDKVDILAVFGN